MGWILINANGYCECCRNPAPFVKEDENKFLEVHHLRRLADGGSDTISNAVGVCPNCHRELHYGKRKLIILEQLYSSIARLERE